MEIESITIRVYCAEDVHSLKRAGAVILAQRVKVDGGASWRYWRMRVPADQVASR